MEIIIITSSFPSHGSESYFEAELKQLSLVFSKVHIVRTLPKPAEKEYHIPTNVVLYEYHQPKTSPLFLPFLHRKSKELFFDEIKSIKSDLRLPFTFLKYKIIHQYLFKAFHFSNWLNELIRNNSINAKVIYSYWITEFTLGSIFYKNEFNNSIKVISRTHGWDCFFDRNPENYLPFRKTIIKEATFIFPVSNAGTNQLKNLFKSNNIITRYLGSAHFTQPEKKNKDQFHILSIAFVTPIKQIELLAEAISHLSFEIKWTHIGFKSTDYEIVLKQKIGQILDNKTNIEFNPIPAISQDEINEWISKNYVDLFCSTSKAEGLPVSMMQAQSAGIPIVSTNVGGVSEIVIENETGFLVSAQADPSEISKAIITFYNLNETEKRRIRTNSFDNFKEHFDAVKNFSEFALQLKNLSNQQ